MAYDFKLMVKVATLYYKDGLTQEEISLKIKVSKYQVNRILKRAIESGIIQIKVIDSISEISDLEEKLEKTFKLKRAVVVENLGLSEEEIKTKIGQAAAAYLLEIIKDNEIIGIGWGSSINEVVNHLPNKINKKVEVVQVTGGIHQLALNINGFDIVRRFADKFRTEPHLFYAPAIVESKTLRDMLLNEVSINETFKYFKKINIIIAGIGSLYPKLSSSLVEVEHIAESTVQKSAVADILSHFIDLNGKIVDEDLDNRMVTITNDEILKIPYRMGVAGGEEKAHAILSAIRGKYINILITENKAASKLLKIHN